MVERETASILTDRQRRWFRDNDVPGNQSTTRSRVYKRLRKLIEEDAELVADELENGELNAEEVAKDFSRTELMEGIRAMVAALYLIGRQGDALDVELAIQHGIDRGKRDRIEYLKTRAEDGLGELTLTEWGELRNECPEIAERAAQQVKQHDDIPNDFFISIEEWEEEFTEAVEDSSNEK